MANSDEILKKTTEILSSKAAEREAERTQLERERRELISSLSRDIINVIAPALQAVTQANQMSAENMAELIKGIKVEAPVIPPIQIPAINVPRPSVTVKAPTVNIPRTPEAKVTPINFPNRMDVSMDGVDRKKPLPVMMMDVKGQPMSFSQGSGGGGRSDFLTIKDIKDSTGSSIIDDTGALKIAGSFSATAGTEYSDGESVSSIEGVAMMGDNGDADANVWAIATGSGATGSNSIRVAFATDAVASVSITGATGTLATAQVDSTGVAYSGSNPVPVAVISETLASTAVNVVDSTGVAYSGSNPVPVGGTLAGITADVSIDDGGNVITVDGTVTANPASGTIDTVTAVTNITNSVATAQVDSTGVAYSGSNPIPVSLISGGNSSTIVVGPTPNDIADDGSAPLKVGGIARTANPSAVSANDMVSATYDDVGRALVRPVQVRDLVQTAFAAVITGTETVLKAGASGVFHDMIMLVAANHSDAAVQMDIRQTTGGNIQMSLELPANATQGATIPVPIPQDHADSSWTVDLPDDTQDVDVTALFSIEV